MLKNFFLINKNQISFLTTLVVLVVLASIYFFIYIPNNEKGVQQQRFRALQNVDRNIHSKIENSVALINNILTNYKNGDAGEKQATLDYIRNAPTANFKFTKLDTFTATKEAALKDSTDNNYKIIIQDNTKKISLYSVKKTEYEKTVTSFQLGMELTFEQFIRFLLPENIFDQYMIFSNSKPVYESFPSGISELNKDSVFAGQKGMISAGILSHNVSGTDYKIFLQPVQLTSNTEWVIGGFLSNQRYQDEKNKLPTAVILSLVTILLIIVVTLPWVKLYLMGSKDRLTVTDGISAIFISMLLMSLIFFTFFKYNQPYRETLKEREADDMLSNAITTEFLKEVQQARKSLIQADSLLFSTSNDLQKNDIVNITKNNIAYRNGITSDGLKKLNAILGNLDINQLFWLDEKGEEKINWTSNKENSPHGNFINRKYVKNILSNHAYHLNNVGGSNYYLDQVVSWTSGAFTSLVSINSAANDSNIKVAALSFNVKALDSVILPVGYLFAITDNTGKVLYHSDKSKNLNENMLDEFSDNDYLLSYYQSKTTGNFITKYFGTKYHVQVKPLPNLPYFMLIMNDTQFKETRDMEIYSFSISMMLLLFAFLVLQLVIIFLASARRSFFKKQLMDSSWVGPKKSANKEYMLASLLNFIIIILLSFALLKSTFLEYVFIVLAAISFVAIFLNSVFAYKYFEQKRNVLKFKITALVCLGIFLLLINIAAVRYLDAERIHRFFLFEAACILIMGMLLFYRYSFYKAASKIKSRIAFLKRWDYINSFTLMGLTRLIVTSGIPIIFFYFSSYNYEQHIGSRYKHVEFYNQLVAKYGTGGVEKFLAAKKLPTGAYIDRLWIDSIRLTDPPNMNSDHIHPITEEQRNSIEYLKKFRLFLTDMSVKEDKFYLSHAEDSSYIFNNLLNDACTSNGCTSSYINSSLPSKYIGISSGKLNYIFPGLMRFDLFPIGGFIFWSLLIATLVAFYFVLMNIIKKLFALNLPEIAIWKKLDEKILSDANLNSLVFVIGLPGSGKKFHILNKIKNKEVLTNSGTDLKYDEYDPENSNVFIADLINIPDSTDAVEVKKWEDYVTGVFNRKNKLIIVNHFEYNIQDTNTNRIKLNFLERLMLQDYFKIIILSSIHPVAFLDSVMSQTSLNEQKSIPGEDLERWHVLLGHYRIIMLALDLDDVPKLNNQVPVKISGIVTSTKDDSLLSDAKIKVLHTGVSTFSDSNGEFTIQEQLNLPFTLAISARGYVKEEFVINKTDDYLVAKLDEAYLNWKDKIRAETQYTHFLKRMQQPSIEITENLRADNKLTRSDDLAFKLQVSAHYFYMYIWQSLTKEEKFLLYDLAEDNLVNSFDSYNLSLLLGKGLIIRQDGVLRLFNKGFRNFILTAIGNTEAAKIKNQIRDNGNWGKLKNPLMLVVVAILAFLLTSQEESYSKIITYVAALGAGVPGVLKLFSFFEKPVDKIT